MRNCGHQNSSQIINHTKAAENIVRAIRYGQCQFVEDKFLAQISI